MTLCLVPRRWNVIWDPVGVRLCAVPNARIPDEQVAAEQPEPGHLDDIDRKILALLRADGRASIKSVAREVHVSRASAYNRIERMRDHGVIKGFSVLVDPMRAGFGVSAILLVQTESAGGAELLANIPGVQYAAFVTGTQDMVLLVRAKTVDELRDEIVWRLRHDPNIRSSQTMLVFQELVNEPFILP